MRKARTLSGEAMIPAPTECRVYAWSNRESPQATRCRRKFLRLFPNGFRDEQYLHWERNYKWKAHREWEGELNRAAYRSLFREGEYPEIAARAVRIESRTNLFSTIQVLRKKSLRGNQPFQGIRETIRIKKLTKKHQCKKTFLVITKQPVTHPGASPSTTFPFESQYRRVGVDLRFTNQRSNEPDDVSLCKITNHQSE